MAGAGEAQKKLASDSDKQCVLSARVCERVGSSTTPSTTTTQPPLEVPAEVAGAVATLSSFLRPAGRQGLEGAPGHIWAALRDLQAFLRARQAGGL